MGDHLVDTGAARDVVVKPLIDKANHNHSSHLSIVPFPPIDQIVQPYIAWWYISVYCCGKGLIETHFNECNSLRPGLW